MNLNDTILKINRLKSEIEWYGVPNKETLDNFWAKIRLDWNYHSNKLEDSSVTLQEVQKVVLSGEKIKKGRNSIQIQGHDEAIREILLSYNERKPLTEYFIRSLHQQMLKQPYRTNAVTAEGKPTTKLIKVGDYKDSPNNVRDESNIKRTLYASPEETKFLMPELVAWCNEALDNNNEHPIKIATEFHYRFIRIHPFDDGNGRMVRLLSNLILLQSGFPPIIINTEDKDGYLNVLNKTDKALENNLNEFTCYLGSYWSSPLKIGQNYFGYQ